MQIQRKIHGTFNRQQNKVHHKYLLARGGCWLARKIISMKTLYEEHSSKTYIYYTCIYVTLVRKSICMKTLHE